MTEPLPEADQATQPTGPPGWVNGFITTLTYVAVFVAAFMLALIGAFHIPSRPSLLGWHLPVAVIFAVIGNLALGVLAGWGLRGRSGAAVAFIGWILGVGVVMFGGTDDVVVGGAAGDWVPLGFLFAGSAACVLAVGISVIFADPAARRRSRPPGGSDPKSSLRTSGRR